MERIIIATHNAHKVAELRMLFAGYASDREFVSLREAGFDSEIEENADTFMGNALIKASAVAKATGCTAFADDSGLVVDALGGAPGVYSARYAGTPCDDGKNIAKLLDALSCVPDAERTARFVSCFVAVTPDGREYKASGECEGIILREKRGSGDFGYDPVFWYPPFGKTFAEMTPEEKNGVSHRGKAVRNFIKVYF